jgi:hypothetical protein
VPTVKLEVQELRCLHSDAMGHWGTDLEEEGGGVGSGVMGRRHDWVRGATVQKSSTIPRLCESAHCMPIFFQPPSHHPPSDFLTDVTYQWL